MALASTAYYATFDFATTGLLKLDISETLDKALYMDTHLLGALQRKGAVQMDSPVGDIVFYWDEDALFSDTVTTTVSQTSTATSIVLTAGHGARCHVGDYLYDTVVSSQEMMQITAIATDTLTVTRTVNSTTALSIAASATLALIRSEQEGSDIGTDVTQTPTVRTGYTQIFSGRADIILTGSQLARRTIAAGDLQDQLAHQLANRMTEFKIGLTRAVCYAPLLGPGSDTVYRGMGSLSYWANNGGGVVATGVGALNSTPLNTHARTLYGRGGNPDTLVAHHALAQSLATIDSSNRRMVESETQVGYFIQEVTTDVGVSLEVVLDNRLRTGSAFIAQSEKVQLVPYADRGMFVIAATDFADARKRRLLGEWAFKLHHPSLIAELVGAT